MQEKQNDTTMQKMLQIAELIEQGKENQEAKVQTIYYYKDFTFEGSGLAETNLLIAKIENEKENTTTYEIYSGKTNHLIATVDEQGKLHFMPQYIESLKQIDARYVKMLRLENLQFELPQELEKEDRVLVRQEREHIISKQRAQKRKEQLQEKNKEDKEQEEIEEDKPKSKEGEEEKKAQIAQAKKVSSHHILVVKENSNLYKDHPNLEPNLFFYRDAQGVVRAEYIDENGQIRASKYFEESTTGLREQTVRLGDDGSPVTKQMPSQVMKTKGLNSADKDIRDIRICINFDQYGYLQLEEARQGKNGEWLSHDIEVKGRNNNSHEVNEQTSIKTRKADPDKQTKAYENTENTGLGKDDDGVQYHEMYLISHAEEFVESLIEEGYQRPEAVQIVNYCLGEEKLSLQQAKEKVNREIENGQIEQEKTLQEERKQEDEQRTPWGDAEARRLRK